MTGTTEPMAPRNFFAALYDLSFHAFVTPKIIRVIYVIALVVAALWSLTFLLTGLGTLAAGAQYAQFGGAGSMVFFGFLQILAAPVGFVLASIVIRVYLEFAMAVFRIAENTEATRERNAAD